eukprot:g10217.t1
MNARLPSTEAHMAQCQNMSKTYNSTILLEQVGEQKTKMPKSMPGPSSNATFDNRNAKVARKSKDRKMPIMAKRAGKDATREFTEEEVAKHNKDDDVWMIIHGKVYDVTKFLEDHPGGPDIMISVAGKDATDQFEEVFHSEKARQQALEFVVGKVKGYTGADDAIMQSMSGSKSGGGGSSFNAMLVPAFLLIVLALYKFYS